MRYLVLLLALCVATPAVAQPSPPTDKREKVKQKIRALRAYTLTEHLVLDEKTAGKLFPVLAKWDDVTDKLMGARVDLLRRLAIDDGRDPKVTDKLIDESIANQRALADLEDKRLVELRKILTPQQTAKLIVVLPQFERRIRNQLYRAIERGGGSRGNRRGRANRVDDTDLRDPFPEGDGWNDLDDDDALDTPRRGERGSGNRGRASERRLPERAPPTPGSPKSACDPFANPMGCR